MEETMGGRMGNNEQHMTIGCGNGRADRRRYDVYYSLGNMSQLFDYQKNNNVFAWVKMIDWPDGSRLVRKFNTITQSR